MWRRMSMLLLLLILMGCGQAGTSAMAADAGTTAQAAFDASQAQDEAGLTAMFSSSVGTLANPLAFQAMAEARQMRNLLGDVTNHTLEAAQQHGATTVIPVFVTYTHGTTRWEFTMTHEGERWGLLEIHEKILTQP